MEGAPLGMPFLLPAWMTDNDGVKLFNRIAHGTA